MTNKLILLIVFITLSSGCATTHHRVNSLSENNTPFYEQHWWKTTCAIGKGVLIGASMYYVLKSINEQDEVYAAQIEAANAERDFWKD